jgi:hypothetical protein
MKIRHEKENLNKAAIKIESYWPVDPVSDEVEKVFYQEIIQAISGSNIHITVNKPVLLCLFFHFFCFFFTATYR